VLDILVRFCILSFNHDNYPLREAFLEWGTETPEIMLTAQGHIGFNSSQTATQACTGMPDVKIYSLKVMESTWNTPVRKRKGE